MTSRKSRSSASGLRKSPRGRTRTWRLAEYRAGVDNPVRLSFKLFAGETRLTRRFARQREPPTGEQRGFTAIWSIYPTWTRSMRDRIDGGGPERRPTERRTIPGVRSRALRREFDLLLRLFALSSLFSLDRRDQYARIDPREGSVYSSINLENARCGQTLILRMEV